VTTSRDPLLPARAKSSAPSQRQLRVGELVRHALSEILVRAEIQDDDLSGAVITVSEVRVSPDVRNATAFVIPLGGERQEAIVNALNRNKRYLRGELARAVQLKFVPSLSFELDKTFDESDRIAKVLRSPEVARDLDPK